MVSGPNNPDTHAIVSALRELKRPERVDDYEILEELGEGGMGTVYLAQQKKPSRRVALKVIKLGMDSREVMRRFEREQETLARLNHDAIAKVFSVGVAETGQPYFVMEWVEGQPLNVFCEFHQLSLTHRLQLFQKICAGVEYAHNQGVVHRDLKPGNVLISHKGADPQPKIIDFGLARALEPGLHATITELGQVLGTPEYMAPEQACRMEGDTITPRTDIYALGVVLYELVTTELPFTALGRRGFLEMQRVLREEEPPRPSARVSRDAEHLGEVAKRLGESPRALRAALRNDLDWIVAKAMAKAPEERYESAALLAADVGRFLDGEPLQAGPPSPVHVLRKYLRRHRVQAITGALISVAVIVAFVAIAIGLDQAQASNANTLMSAARLAHTRGSWGDALDLLDQAAATNRVEPTEICIARILAHLGGFDDRRATEQLRRLARMDVPAKLAGRVRLMGGIFANRAGDPEAGLDDIRAAIDLGGLTENEVDIAGALLAEDFDTAHAAIDRVLARDPLDRLAIMWKVSLLFCSGQLEESRRFSIVLHALYPNDPISAVLDLLVGVLTNGEEAAFRALDRLNIDHDEGLDVAARQIIKSMSFLTGFDEQIVRAVFDEEEFGVLQSISLSFNSVAIFGAMVRFFGSARGEAGVRAFETLGSILPPFFLRGIRSVPALLPTALRMDSAAVSAREHRTVRESIRSAADKTGIGLFRFMSAYIMAMDGDHAQAIDEYERAARAGSLVPVPRSIERGLLASRIALRDTATDPAERRRLEKLAGENLRRLWPAQKRQRGLANLLDAAVGLGDSQAVLGIVEHWKKLDPAETATVEKHIRERILKCKDPRIIEIMRAAIRD